MTETLLQPLRPRRFFLAAEAEQGLYSLLLEPIQVAGRSRRWTNRQLIHQHPIDGKAAGHQLVLFSSLIRANTLATLVRGWPTALIESLATTRAVRLTMTVSPSRRGGLRVLDAPSLSFSWNFSRVADPLRLIVSSSTLLLLARQVRGLKC